MYKMPSNQKVQYQQLQTPRGFASGDAGKGVLLDASIVDPSYSASMLSNAVTFITPV